MLHKLLPTESGERLKVETIETKNITNLALSPFPVRQKRKTKSSMSYLSSRLRAKRDSGLPKERWRIRVGKD